MNTVTIDSKIYKEVARYASRKKISISHLFEVAVSKYLNINTSTQGSGIYDSREFIDALVYMDSLMSSDDENISIPTDENGKEIKSDKYL